MTDEITTKSIGYKPTDPSFLETFTTLQGGTVADLTTRMLADVAMATAEFGDKKRKGKLTLTLEIVPAKGDAMLQINHTLAYSHPTARGVKTETVGDGQIMFVNRKGALSPTPDAQGKFDFSAQG